MADEKTELWQQRGELDRQRREKIQAAIKEYDREIYYPALRLIVEKCAATGGHRGGKFHNNGLGWSWFYCSICGTRYDMNGPDGQDNVS